MQRYFHVFQTNIRAMGRYVPHSYPKRITLFKASEPSPFSPQDPTMGWDALAGGGLEIHSVPGSHYTMLKEPHVQAAAERLRDCLQRAQKDDGILGGPRGPRDS